MTGGTFNRQGRRSGGNRPTRFSVAAVGLTEDDLEIMKQEAIVRAHFGEDGVKLFWKLLEQRADAKEKEENE